MRAIRYYGPGDVRLDHIPEPQARENQVKIKVAWNGICGSDLHSYFMILPVSPTSTTPNPVTNEVLPVVMGHEFSGTIVELGSGANTTRFRVGQNVVVEPLLSCRKASCDSCSDGTRNLCPQTTFIGLGGLGGGLSEYISVDQDAVYPLPDGVPLEVGALMEPLAVAWHALKRSNIKPGDSVFILGAGPIGLLTLRAARAFGAKWIGISEPALKRRELAIAQEANAVYDPAAKDVDILAAVREATNGRGADVVFDCAGNQRTVDMAFEVVRARGNIVNVAVWEQKPVINMNTMTFKEVTFTGVLAYDCNHPEMLEAVAQGKFDNLAGIITRRIPLEDVVEKGIQALIHEKDEHAKILVYPGLTPS